MFNNFVYGKYQVEPRTGNKMMKSNVTHTLFAEIFPIKTNALPPLFSYRLDVNGGDYSTIGGKLSYRLKKSFEGHWAWAGGRIVTDNPREQSEIMNVVRTLWSEMPEIFRGLHSVNQVDNWQPSADTIAEFVVRGLLSDKYPQIRQLLDQKRRDLGNAHIERVYDLRGWVVEGQPAVSIAISSNIIFKEDCRTYAKRVKEDELIGLLVGDKTSTFKGEIVKIAGYLSTERERLLSITKRQETKKLINDTGDEELVVSIANGHIHPYDYIAGALKIIPRMEDLGRFGINAAHALKEMRLEPSYRARLVGEITETLGNQYISRGYNSDNNPQLFTLAPLSSQIRVGKSQVVVYDDKTLLSNLQRNGLYKVADKFKNDTPIRVGILNALPSSNGAFWSGLELQIKKLGVHLEQVSEVNLRSTARVEIEKAVSILQTQQPDIVLAYLPDQYDSEEDVDTAYFHLKALTVAKGIATQVVEQSTLTNQYAVGNIIMGIVGKTGNIPFILAEPLDFADIIVGIDIAREKKKRLVGSINATAIARIYLNNGEFLGYTIHDTPLEGETIPTSVLQSLFPVSEFSGKRVVIHRDGYFRGEEKDALLAWAEQIDAQFHLIEIIKSGAPRIYRTSQKQTIQPDKGSAFLISHTEALLVSSLPPFKNATPRPLRVVTAPSLTISQAIQSVLSMTLLHYGSLRSPRLPVTIHYSDKIAYMALRGIKPKDLDGTIPFWL